MRHLIAPISKLDYRHSEHKAFIGLSKSNVGENISLGLEKRGICNRGIGDPAIAKWVDTSTALPF